MTILKFILDGLIFSAYTILIFWFGFKAGEDW